VKITHLGHSAVLAEFAGRRILIDPGNIDPQWHGLTGLDLILVTHQHADHLDPAEAPALFAANPQARVIVEPSIVALAGHEVPGVGVIPQIPDVETLEPGETATLDPVTITAVGGRHAVIHADIPRIGNIGYLLAADGEPTLFHPGDSYEFTPSEVDVLAFPTQAPWAALKEGIDFARAIGAPLGFPIHDGLLRDVGRTMVFGRINAMTPTQLVDLRGAGAYEF